MVEELIAFKRKIQKTLEVSFEKNEAYSHSIREGFEHFINKRQNKPAELLAQFIDKQLRRGQKKHTENELETILDEVITLFRSIESKDIFQGHYRNVSIAQLVVLLSIHNYSYYQLVC